MVSTADYMSQYQKSLYKERHYNEKPSKTYESDIFHGFHRPRNESAASVNHSASDGDSSASCVKAPWGRARSYAGDGPVCLPTEHRPKSEPPLVLQKTHHHFGSGLFAYPRGCPFYQYYDLTHLKKSNLRWNDELIPRPSTSQVHEKQIRVPIPKEHPLSSHMSRQALFPKFDNPTDNPLCGRGNIDQDYCLPALVPVNPPAIVVHKAMGNFARREICTPQASSMRHAQTWPETRNRQPLPVRNTWFSKHEIISEFNKKYPSVIPMIALNMQKKRAADWLANNASTAPS